MEKYSIHNILIAEDDEIDMIALERVIAKIPHQNLYKATSYSEATEHLKDQEIDLFITDYYLGDGEAINILEDIKIPTIFITGSNQIDLAVTAMKEGAKDYLVKDVEGKYLEILPIIVTRIETNLANEIKLSTIRAQFQDMIENTNDMVSIIDAQTHEFQYANPAFLNKSGYTLDDLNESSFNYINLFDPSYQEKINELVTSATSVSASVEAEFINSEKNRFLVKVHIAKNQDHQGDAIRFVLTDISKKKQLQSEIVDILNKSVEEN